MTSKHLFQVDYTHLESGEPEVAYVLTPTKYPYKHRLLLRRKGYARQKMTYLGPVPYEAAAPTTLEEANNLLKE